MDAKIFVLLASGVFVVLIVRRYMAARSLRKIRGPPSPSWLMGE